MKFEEREGLILLFQIDHFSGEEAGWLLEAETIPGLRNRQLIPTVTKKGRPGYLLLLDVDPSQEDKAVQALAGHLPLFGYHRLPTRHLFQRGVLGRISVLIRAADGRSFQALVRCRRTSLGQTPRTFFEADDLLEIQRRARELLGVEITPYDLRQRLEEGSRKGAEPIEMTF
jgi:hypothetical protein